ncbi:fibrinogen C domain-containing protein 1-like [Pocillopora damicornis]|uniref:fibrinogen C domain-containing protein 1-like n=1 Tax=Pocillopora damicornis TaxID=46731 RepID=UPI000F55895E|nr:fibrinogen C domain-containing protein 1-like [Pocillopora damicornis]
MPRSLQILLLLALASRNQILSRPITSFAANCAELYKAGNKTSGVYTIYPDGLSAFDVYCDQSTGGGGWTVIQKRMDGSVNFARSWCDYKHGFGNLSGEFWLGLDKINRLTWRTKNKLRIDLEFNLTLGIRRIFEEYNLLVVEPELQDYALTIGSVLTGNASDSFDYNRNASFFTMEKDTPDGCAKKYGAWWYPNNETCGNSNLNGQYKQIDGLRWARWSQYRPRELQYTATKAEMKIKPDCFG